MFHVSHSKKRCADEELLEVLNSTVVYHKVLASKADELQAQMSDEGRPTHPLPLSPKKKKKL